MKKPKRRDGKPKQPPNKQAPAQRQSQPPPPKDQKLLRWLAWIGTTILAAIALVGGIYQFSGGPPWPTEPDIEPGGPEISSPFSVAFTVANTSSFFDIKDAQFRCDYKNITTASHWGIQGFSSKTDQLNTIPPLTSRPFKCTYPFGGAGDVTLANIFINVNYTYDLLGQHSRDITAGPFVWDKTTNPPRWVKGALMR